MKEENLQENKAGLRTWGFLTCWIRIRHFFQRIRLRIQPCTNKIYELTRIYICGNRNAKKHFHLKRFLYKKKNQMSKHTLKINTQNSF